MTLMVENRRNDRRTGGKRPDTRRRERKTPAEIKAEKLVAWVPKTRTGKLVQAGEITTIEEIYSKNLPLLEPQIIDVIVPELQEEVLNIKAVQRTTDAGRKRSFLVTVVVGNKNGYVGVGKGRGLNVRTAKEKAV